MDDNQADVFLIREALSCAGVEADVREVHDGQQATALFDALDLEKSAPPPDLILLDLNLPKTSGDDVLRHLRNSVRCRDARVIIVTSSNSQRDREKLRELGADDYFPKPSDYDAFLKLGPIVKRLL